VSADSATSSEYTLDGGDHYINMNIWRFKLSSLLMKRQRWSEALSSLQAVHKEYGTIKLAEASCHLHLSQYDECLEAAQAALRLEPSKADGWGLCAYGMLHKEMWNSAETCFNLYLERIVPGQGAAFISSWLLIELGFIWAKKRPGVIGGGKAEACALQALRISGASAKVHWLLGESMVASRMTERGVMEMLTAAQAYGKEGDGGKVQKEQVLLRAMSLANTSAASAATGGVSGLYETVKAAVIKHAPHLLSKVVPAAPVVPRIMLA
jgi:tetratricopeptide (TPR) repeat protein